MKILAAEVLNFPPKLTRDVVLAMTSTISKWPNLSVRGEERVILYVFLNIHTNVTRYIIVSNDNLYEDYPLPRIKFCSKIFNELVRENIHSSGGVNGKNMRLLSTENSRVPMLQGIS